MEVVAATSQGIEASIHQTLQLDSLLPFIDGVVVTNHLQDVFVHTNSTRCWLDYYISTKINQDNNIKKKGIFVKVCKNSNQIQINLFCVLLKSLSLTILR